MNNGLFGGLFCSFLAALVTMLGMKYSLPDPMFIRASGTMILYTFGAVVATMLVFGALYETRLREFGAHLFFGSGVFLFTLFGVACVIT